MYLLDDPPPPPLPKSWQTWLPGHRPPRFALEVVSDDWRKDYEEAPLKYAQLGTAELVIFDPEAALGEAKQGRCALQVYRREADGAFVRSYRGPGPMSSIEIGATLIVQREGPIVRLRVARDAAGLDLVPTTDEARADAERRALSERQRREAVENELASAREEIDRLRRG